MLGIFLRLFGFGGPRSPEGPSRFEQEILIAASPMQLFPLVDWRDERHLWRQLGHRVEQEGERFVLLVKEMPDTRFEIALADVRQPAFYSYDSVTLPMIGKLISSHEEYRFEQLPGGICRVTLTVDAYFVPGLRPSAWRFEQTKMDISVRNTLRKLKLMAEKGLAAVEEASRRLVV